MTTLTVPGNEEIFAILEALKRLFQHFSAAFYACCCFIMPLLKKIVKIKKDTFYPNFKQLGRCATSVAPRLRLPCAKDVAKHLQRHLTDNYFCKLSYVIDILDVFYVYLLIYVS